MLVGSQSLHLERFATNLAERLILRTLRLVILFLIQGDLPAAVGAMLVGAEVSRLEPALADPAELSVLATTFFMQHPLVCVHHPAAIAAMRMGSCVRSMDPTFTCAAELHAFNGPKPASGAVAQRKHLCTRSAIGGGGAHVKP
mmetsp:Transcript_63541/g.95923  ORF Transcript_63541/g.95923 Transcript_63541/m.95923 type:complete len:143 (+) Transcript_63541:131-559(+)